MDDVRCRPHGPERSCEECCTANEIAFTRSGMFVRHVGSRQTVVDANQALFFAAGEPYQVSHPAGAGDDCTAIRFSPSVLVDACAQVDASALDRADRPFRFSAAPVSPATFLHAERLRRGIRHGRLEPLAADESAIELLSEVLHDAHQLKRSRSPAAHRRTRAAHRAWVDGVRIEMGRRFTERLTLADAARSVHCSPFHLARLFRQHTGTPLHRYVNRLRLRAALDRLGDVHDLTGLALQLGFSSHSHFTTAFRLEFGASPAAIRRELTAPRRREMSKILKA